MLIFTKCLFETQGYNKLSTIPAKSTNIFIHRQRDGDDLGCLVIRSASSFLLNGHYVISKTSTSIKFDGKIIDYIVNDTDEIIKSPGNLTQQLEIQVNRIVVVGILLVHRLKMSLSAE